MAVWSRRVLSGSTNGRPIHIVSQANPGTVLHTCSTATSVVDHPYINVWNVTTATMLLTLLSGGTATGDELLIYIPGQSGKYAITNGSALNGATGVVVAAFSTATAGLFADGYVDRAS